MFTQRSSYIGKLQPKNMHICKSQHGIRLESVPRKILCLLIILTDDAIKQLCDVISVSHTTHRHLFSNFSPFHSPIKEKGKQGRKKGLTMAQCINLNRNNRSVLACWYSVLWEKIGPVLSPLVGLTTGRLDYNYN